MKLTIAIATRNRPQLLTKHLHFLRDNIERPDTTIMVAADDDDLDTIRAIESEHPSVLLSVAPRPDAPALKWNRAIKEAPADVYMPMTDHVIVNTKGFDTRIMDAAALFPDGIGCVYFPLEPSGFTAMQCLTARLVDMLGYIFPPYFPYWFVDTWIDEISRMIGRIAMVDVETTCQWQGTMGQRDLAFWAEFFEACSEHRQHLAATIIAQLDEPEWRKQALLSAFAMTVYPSLLHTHVLKQRGNKEPERKESDEHEQQYAELKELARSTIAMAAERRAA